MNDQPSTSSPTILVADDDQFITIAYKAGLESAGYVVITACDGDEALEMIVNSRPDLVLLDVIMPKQNGFEVLKVIKSTPEVAHIPVIVLTNLSQPSDQEDALTHGAAHFLVKSNVSLKDVLMHIEQLLAGQSAVTQ